MKKQDRSQDLFSGLPSQPIEMWSPSVEMIADLSRRLETLRGSPGMPIGTDEAVLAISLPPYFTALPNPHISSLIDRWRQAVPQHAHAPIQAFASDVSTGKNEPIYFAHYYSTKVPPRAIARHILHYTQPGDIVFDGFSGTGMTGVAAQCCADPELVAELGGTPGLRRAILSDVSPAATFISAHTNSLRQFGGLLSRVEEAISKVEDDYAWMLATDHNGWPRGSAHRINHQMSETSKLSGVKGKIEYIVWSDVFACPHCAAELIWWDLVFRGPGKSMPKMVECTGCRAEHTINSLERVWTQTHDELLGRVVRQAKQVPVLINYSVGSRRFEKTPDSRDIDTLNRIARESIPGAAPIVPMPKGFNTAQPLQSHGLSHAHHFFTRRNLILMISLKKGLDRIAASHADKGRGLYLLTGMIQRVCRLNRYMPNHDRHVGPLSGTLYVSQLTAEIPATNYIRDRIEDLRRCIPAPGGEGIAVSTQSSTDLRNIPSDSIDYIFTDPPFGGNINYSELNILVEAWLGVRTEISLEAIVNEQQRKTLADYAEIMGNCFREFYRILKPGKWITVEFHNSSNAVWTTIQNGLGDSGFVIADVRTLDKVKGTTKQLTYAATVKQDLIIAAYKPNGGLEERFGLTAGTEAGVWDFVRMHLKQLPIFASKDGQAEVIAERLNYLLFDRMVAFHVQRGVTVPLSAAEYYAGLAQRFPEREGMYFLTEQVAEYDKKRMAVRDLLQLQLFVTDESSGIQWLKQQLVAKPQTFQELHPQFLKEIGGWQKHEKPLELSELLEQNFLRYDGKDEVSSQIHSYLSTNFKELRNLPKDDESLRSKGKDRWYVPDPNKAGDLEKLRDRALLKEFDEYRESKQKQLKIFRLEAVRCGFKKAWQERDYATIIAVAGKIPENVLQEDPKLLMWYDQAVTRSGDSPS